MTMIIGDVHGVPSSPPRRITHSNETTKLQEGDVIQIFDYILEWDKDCVTEEQSRAWRRTGDPMCDEALQVVFPSSSSSVGKDLLACVEGYATEHPECEAVKAFLEEVSRAPPPGIQTTARDVQLSQELFLDNAIEIVQALLHYSLAGGFASPRIVRTLQAVSYLVPHTKKSAQVPIDPSSIDTPASAEASARITNTSNERTFIRLLETFQFVLDILDCSSIPPRFQSHDGSTCELRDAASKSLVSEESVFAYLMPGGEGWRSTVNVRLLHGVARMRVRERWRREGRDVSEDEAVPISQEELGGTLAAFSTVPMWCLHRLHVPPSQAHASAYLALWRHVGFYLGVSPSILLRHFSSTLKADKFIATTALLHLFSLDDPTDVADAPTIPILRAASDRPPTFTSFEYNCALTQHLLGPALALRVGLGEPRLAMRMAMHARLLVQRIPHWFVRWYPRKAWAAKRRAVMREGIARSLRYHLGMRRVSFRPRTAIAEEGAPGMGQGGEIAPGVREVESVKRDPAGVALLVRRWQEVIVEMVAVCGAVGLLGVGVGWLALRRVPIRI